MGAHEAQYQHSSSAVLIVGHCNLHTLVFLFYSDLDALYNSTYVFYSVCRLCSTSIFYLLGCGDFLSAGWVVHSRGKLWRIFPVAFLHVGPARPVLGMWVKFSGRVLSTWYQSFRYPVLSDCPLMNLVSY